MSKKDVKKTKVKKKVVKKKTQPPKAEKKVEPEVNEPTPELQPEPTPEPKQYFGVNAIPVLKIEQIAINEKPMKAVSLADGTIIKLSDKELAVRLEEGNKNK